jgi:outer membrane receptor protein involved in Fe transport
MKYCIRLLLCIALLFNAFLSLCAQERAKDTTAFSFYVYNHQKEAVEGVTVALYSASDTVLRRTALSEKTGVVQLTGLPAGQYFLKLTHTSYQTLFTPVFTLPASNTLTSFALQQAGAKTMEEVTVTSQKPFIQRLQDRIVVNIEGSPLSAGASAIEVLERSPGITLDQNDVVSLRGKAGVLVLIDGKPTPMSGADLTAYLRSLPASALDRIEIITNPSAKYEAAGTAGIIDIRFKKDQRLGTNGTFTAAIGHGVLPKTNTGATFNYRSKKVNLFGSYNLSYRKDMNDLTQNRNFFRNRKFAGSDRKENYLVNTSTGNNLRLGADYYVSTKTTLGVVLSGNRNRSRPVSVNQSTNLDESGRSVSLFTTNINNRGRSLNGMANLNLRHQFTKDRELTFDVDYGLFRSAALSSILTRFFGTNGSSSKPEDLLEGDQTGRLTLKAAKGDYTSRGKNGIKWEMGARASVVNADNDVQFFNVLPAVRKVDSTKTNRFFYEEYNGAAYINAGRQWKKWGVQVGLRGEQTVINTTQVVGKINWDSSYLQLFPSAFVNYKPTANQTIGVSVSRRIGRPAYGQLNPFLFISDATAYTTGNPGLLPQLTWSFEANYTYKNLLLVMEYSRTSQPQVLVIAPILSVLPNFPIDPRADSNISVERTVNLGATNHYGLTVSVPVRFAKWWNSFNNANLLYNRFEGNVGGVALDNGMPALYLRSNHSFSFKKSWAAELNAAFFSGRRSGYAVFRPQGAVAVGIQKNVLKGGGTVRLNVSDIFRTSVLRFAAEYKGVYNDVGTAIRDTRVVNLGFTYRFGNNKVEAAKKRTTAAEEESRRAN